MALAVNDLVYLNVNSGLRSDPPLFGRVDEIAGDPPNVTRVNWENGANQTFTSADPALLTKIQLDADQEDWIGKWVNGPNTPGGRVSGYVARTWIDDPDGNNVQTALVRTENDDYFIAETSNLQIIEDR